MLNPGIGAPPKKIGNWHPNISSAVAHDQPYALRHRMSGYISKGMSRNGYDARGGSGHYSYETGQAYERRMSTNDFEKNVGSGISGGRSGCGGKDICEAKQGLRRTGTRCTPLKPVIVKGAVDQMPTTGCSGVAKSCEAYPTRFAGHVKDHAPIRGYGIAGITNKNKRDMAVSSRRTSGLTVRSTICSPITPSPNDDLNSIPRDNGISSFLNNDPDWSDFYSDKSNPLYDVTFDDFFDA